MIYGAVCSTEEREIRSPEQISPRVLTVKPVRLGFTARRTRLRHYVMTTNTATQAIGGDTCARRCRRARTRQRNH